MYDVFAKTLSTQCIINTTSHPWPLVSWIVERVTKFPETLPSYLAAAWMCKNFDSRVGVSSPDWISANSSHILRIRSDSSTSDSEAVSASDGFTSAF